MTAPHLAEVQLTGGGADAAPPPRVSASFNVYEKGAALQAGGWVKNVVTQYVRTSTHLILGLAFHGRNQDRDCDPQKGESALTRRVPVQ